MQIWNFRGAGTSVTDAAQMMLYSGLAQQFFAKKKDSDEKTAKLHALRAVTRIGVAAHKLYVAPFKASPTRIMVVLTTLFKMLGNGTVSGVCRLPQQLRHHLRTALPNQPDKNAVIRHMQPFLEEQVAKHEMWIGMVPLAVAH